MDIALAQTFLMVAETGSFIDAARKLNITQSTVSARIRGLEELFGRPLFERSKNGASLTGAGEQFQKHALALVRVWQHAQLEVGFSGPYRDHLAVGAHATLWDGFLMRWISWLRDNIPDIAISVRDQPDYDHSHLNGVPESGLRVLDAGRVNPVAATSGI